MKTAFVHDWLTGMRGGEKVLEAACELFPQADIFTLIHDPERISPLINSRRIHAARAWSPARGALPVRGTGSMGWNLGA